MNENDQNKKVNVDRPPVSDQEINARRNFEEVLNQVKPAGHGAGSAKPFYKSNGFIAAAVLAGAVTAGALLMDPEKDKETVSDKDPAVPAKEMASSAPMAPKAVPFVNPPSVKADIPYSAYKVNAEKGGTVKHKTGSSLYIPANSFVDEAGNAVTGEVEIRYREFHDVAEIFTSGIPMTYDSAGQRYHFESAGMIDVRAFQDGRQLFLAEGKKVRVEMATRSENQNTEYNLYKLDTAKRNWTYKGTNLEKKSGSAPAAKPAGPVKKTNPQVVARPEKLLPGLSSAAGEAKKAYTEIEMTRQEIERMEKEERPLEPKKASGSRHTFSIDVNGREYPELAHYRNVLFEVGEENREFTRDYYKIVWDDAQLSEGTRKGENYELTLTKEEKKIKLIVYPVFEGKNYEEARLEYEKKWEQYQTVLAQRKEEEKQKQKEYEQRMEELKRRREEAEKQWAQQRVQANVTAARQSLMLTAFTIDNFGVWNCDRPQVYPSARRVAAVFQDSKGAVLETINLVYLGDIKRKGVYTYNRGNFHKFGFNPRSVNVLFGLTAEGHIYYLKAEEFARMAVSDEKCYFRMERLPDTVNSADEIKKLLGI